MQCVFLNCSLYFSTRFLFLCVLQGTDSVSADFKLSKFNKRGVWNSDGRVGKNRKINNREGTTIRYFRVRPGFYFFVFRDNPLGVSL